MQRDKLVYTDLCMMIRTMPLNNVIHYSRLTYLMSYYHSYHGMGVTMGCGRCYESPAPAGQCIANTNLLQLYGEL